MDTQGRVGCAINGERGGDMKKCGIGKINTMIGLLMAMGLCGCAASKEAMDIGMANSEADMAFDSDSYGEEAAPDAGTTDDGYGSEEEKSILGLRPASTNQYVFVANSDRDTVTRIDVATLEVMTASVGVYPSMVVTSADYTTAVTFNAGSDSISVVDTQTLAVTEVEIRSNLNQMKISPDGRWVICYHDASAEDDGRVAGAISYNEISVVDIESLNHFETVVGAFPHDVQFTSDSLVAVMVSDDYLAVIDLDPDGPTTQRIPLSDQSVDALTAEEVLLDPDGQYAIVRQYGAQNLVLVNLLEGVTSSLSVGSNPTDMDLSGSGDEAIVVARGSGELWIYDLDDPEGDPDVVTLPEAMVFGSLVMTPDDERGFLFTTAIDQALYGVWDRMTNEVTVRSLVKPISSFEVSPDGLTGVVFHPQTNGDLKWDSPFFNHYAMTLIDLSDLFTNPIRLDGKPMAYDNIDDGTRGFVVLEEMPHLIIMDYETLIHDEISLPSEPTFLGILPQTPTVYVSQEHALGRISFFDSVADEIQTITGFELNAAIED